MTRHSTRGILSLVAAASLLLTACSDDSTTSSAPATQSTPHTEQTEDTGDTEPTWRLLSDEPEGVPIAAGTYGLIANGVSDHVAVVQAPGGYQNFGGWTFGTGEPFRGVGFLTADRVYPDPCGAERHSKFDEGMDPGPSVEDLADALVAQKGAVTSEPKPVTVDGYKGLFLTYRIAKGIDVPKCEARTFDILSTGPGAWYLHASRERAAEWIVDVDGERLVLGWVAVPGVTQAQMHEMTRMVESARFVEP